MPQSHMLTTGVRCPDNCVLLAMSERGASRQGTRGAGMAGALAGMRRVLLAAGAGLSHTPGAPSPAPSAPSGCEPHPLGYKIGDEGYILPVATPTGGGSMAERIKKAGSYCSVAIASLLIYEGSPLICLGGCQGEHMVPETGASRLRWGTSNDAFLNSYQRNICS